MADNSQKSGVPVTTVILLMVMTALCVAVAMLWLDKKKDISAAAEFFGNQSASAESESVAEEHGEEMAAEERAVLEEILEISSAETKTAEGSAAEEKSDESLADEKEAKAAPALPKASEIVAETKPAPVSESDYVDPAKACCTINTLSSTGTGFAIRRGDRTYVMTCRHLVEGSPVLIISNADGKELKVKKTLVAKDRDLAVIEIDPPEGGTDCLPLRASLSVFAKGRKIACYVDTLGKGFVDKCEGKIKAVNASYMDIDASFLPSCGGGPAVLAGTNLVVGVASPLKRFSETEAHILEVSRFETEPKRYIARADDLDWNDLSETAFGKVGKNDLKGIKEQALAAIGAGDLRKGADLLLYSARKGDKEALELWCDVTFRLLMDQKNHPVLDALSSEGFDFMKEAAEGGSAGALLDLGVCYLYGICAPKDQSLGFAKIEEAVRSGCVRALYMEGYCRYCGNGTAADLKEAFRSFKTGAEKGDAFCMKALGSFYLNDDRPTEAFPWYEKAAGLEDPEAIFALGVLYDNGYGVQKNKEAALEHFKKAARMGHAPAQSRLGKIFDKDEDYLSAAKWYDLAAQKYDAEAVEKLGSYYLRGIGGKPEDDDTAFMYLSFAAQLGRTAAMTFMGNYHYDLKNYASAFDLYRKAAAKEDPEAIYKLGLMYENGLSVSQDHNTAFKCFKVAADRGYADAWVNLGIDYLLARGTGKDLDQARIWISKAAESGNPAAQVIFGDIYFNGWGVPANYSTAAYWYEQAEKGGAPEAGEKLAQLRKIENEAREKRLEAQLKAQAQYKETLAQETKTPPPFTETLSQEPQTRPQSATVKPETQQTRPQGGEAKTAPPKGRALYRVKESFEKPAQSQYKSPYSKDASRAMLELDVNGPTRIHVGEHFNYAIRVKNSGSGTARNVVVKNTLPIGISLTSDPGTKTFTMNGGEMPPGCVKTFIFEANPDYAGIFIDNVSVSGENFRIKHSSLCTKVINRRGKFWPEP